MFAVLFVCTGNICRSPMAEHLLRAGLQDELGSEAQSITVSSSGTGALVGHSMQPFALAVLEERNIDGSAFRARALHPQQIQEADLILAASREHRAAVVTAHPRGARKTFTVREFHRLLSGVQTVGIQNSENQDNENQDSVSPDAGTPSQARLGEVTARATALVAAARGQRGILRPNHPDDDDITDPYLGPRAGYEATAALLGQTVQRIVALLL